MTTIYVGNLPFTATEDEVRSLFERYGEAQNAIQQTNGFQMGGRPLRVNEAQERAPRSKPPGGGGGGGGGGPRRW
jgi:RNA recognition motif-containing protein